MTEPAVLGVLDADEQPAGLPAPTLGDCVLAAVAETIEGAAPSDGAGELSYLVERLRLVERFSGSWPRAARALARRPAPGDQPLVMLGAELGLSLGEILSVALAAAVEQDVMAGRAVARVQAPLGGSRPTLGLLATVLGTVAGASGLAADLLTGAAARSGLLLIQGQPGPLPERTVAIASHLCLGLHGVDSEPPGARIDGDALIRVPLAASVLQAAQRHALALLREPRRQLLLRTGSEAEGRAVAAAVARAMGKRAVFLAPELPDGLTPWLLLRDLLPVHLVEASPGERKRVPLPPLYEGPTIILTGPDGSIESDDGIALTWRLEVPSPAERRALWHTAIGDPDLAAELAERHRHGSGRIAVLGRLSRHRAALRGAGGPEREDVAAAGWGGEGGGIDALAQPVTGAIGDDALVVGRVLRSELEHLLLRCRVRDGLADELGVTAAARYTPGVRALFVGPSGTGKTLAASWLATHLGMPLYRVDLASVTSKYIGETEKNLAVLLARAEQAEVVLLFDEADAMFGKRTDVKDANDRFANAQTNYLLQRIETYDGIVILTSNSRNRLDSSFARRLDLILEFPMPSAEERRAMWDVHLGTRQDLRAGEINRLAARVELCGGHIRNVVFTAAARARHAGRPIRFSDIAAGLATEYRKLGKQLPAEFIDPRAGTPPVREA
ncbi:MAG: ATP-binding protein [Gemmatimonadales bacterium]